MTMAVTDWDAIEVASAGRLFAVRESIGKRHAWATVVVPSGRDRDLVLSAEIYRAARIAVRGFKQRIGAK